MAKKKRIQYTPLKNPNSVSHKRESKEQIYEKGEITGEMNSKQAIGKGPQGKPENKTHADHILDQRKAEKGTIEKDIINKSNLTQKEEKQLELPLNGGNSKKEISEKGKENKAQLEYQKQQRLNELDKQKENPGKDEKQADKSKDQPEKER